jgi:hypothetical protein
MTSDNEARMKLRVLSILRGGSRIAERWSGGGVVGEGGLGYDIRRLDPTRSVAVVFKMVTVTAYSAKGFKMNGVKAGQEEVNLGGLR